jgi:hypothetical protein
MAKKRAFPSKRYHGKIFIDQFEDELFTETSVVKTSFNHSLKNFSMNTVSASSLFANEILPPT